MLYVDDKINIVYNIHILGEVGVFDIKTLEMIEGDLPAKGQSLVREWAEKHEDDLLKIWNTQEFRKIPPLK